MQKVRTRYAPSPTGYLHIGGAWMAFFNWLFARSQTGAFILRIEDTDRTRSTEEYERAILEDFHWLGLDWEEGPDVGGPAGPYRQTERSHLYRQYAQTLLDRGAAYHCYCTPEELEAERQRARVAKQPYRYSGRCKNLTPEQRAEFERQGRRPTIRLRIHDDGETIVVNDLVRGRVEFDPEHLDDHIIVRSDGSPLYNFANVVDDHTMAITHVIRGIEHLSNTPKQWIMYQALGWEPPQVAHLSNILGTDHKKLSKRTGDTAVRDYKRAGFLPEALLNFFALMAWYPEESREIFSVRELIERFRLKDLGKASPVFDMAKLTWMNGVYMRELLQRDPGRVVDACLEPLRHAGLLDGQVTAQTHAYIRRVVEVLGDPIRPWAGFAACLTHAACEGCGVLDASPSLPFGPGVAQPHNAVEHKPLRARVRWIAPEVSQPFKLIAELRRVVQHAGLDIPLHDRERLRAEGGADIAVTRFRVGHPEEPVVEAHLRPHSVARRDPVDRSFHRASRGRAAQRGRIVRAPQFHEISRRVLHHIVATDDIGMAQPDPAAGDQAIESLGWVL